MNLTDLLTWLKNNPEWTFLILLGLVLAGGGSGYYYYVLQQQEQQALETFRQAEQQYRRAQQDPETDMESAREQLRQVVDQYPSTSIVDKSLFFLARSYYLGDECEEALPLFDRLLADYPDSTFVPATHLHMGECRELLDRPDQAIESYRSVADGPEDHPLWVEGTLRAAELELRQGNASEARTLVNQVLEREDQLPSSWIQQAEALARELDAESG